MPECRHGNNAKRCEICREIDSDSRNEYFYDQDERNVSHQVMEDSLDTEMEVIDVDLFNDGSDDSTN